MRWFSKSPGGVEKDSHPWPRDRWGEPPLCELNFLGKNGEQQEIGYGRKRAPGGRWPAAVEMLMIVGTIPLQTGRATPILIEVQGRSRYAGRTLRPRSNHAQRGA